MTTRSFLLPARFALFLALGTALPAATVDCGGSGGSGGGGSGGGDCFDGVIINGVCEGKCDPALCVAGNVCVGNRCVLPCDSHDDCNAGAQSCLPAVEDDTGAAVTVCTGTFTSGVGLPCPVGDECGALFACPDGGACGASLCGGGACTADPDLCPADQPDCGLGTCDDGTTLCKVPTCDAAACAALQCHTSGEGDALAYCTTPTCATDADCMPGFECALERAPGTICGDTSVGNHPACNTDGEPCIAEGDLASQGLQKGSLCLLRAQCVKKTECSPCETDLDCSYTVNAHCTDLGGSKICAAACATDDDCFPDFQCTGGNGDRCVPRFGACKGTGAFCEPCQNDLDCGGPGSGNACGEISAGRHACFDFNFPDACTVDSDCPDSPSGKPGECLDEPEGLSAGDSVYHRCYYPKNEGSGKFSCW